MTLFNSSGTVSVVNCSVYHQARFTDYDCDTEIVIKICIIRDLQDNMPTLRISEAAIVQIWTNLDPLKIFAVDYLRKINCTIITFSTGYFNVKHLLWPCRKTNK